LCRGKTTGNGPENTKGEVKFLLNSLERPDVSEKKNAVTAVP